MRRDEVVDGGLLVRSPASDLDFGWSGRIIPGSTGFKTPHFPISEGPSRLTDPELLRKTGFFCIPHITGNLEGDPLSKQV